MIFSRKALAVLLLQAPAAFACGYCVEDKVASTYDHAVVLKAVNAKHHVAFFHLEGALARDEATRKALLAAAGSTAGVDRGSVRVALETLTLSFAFDPAKTSLVKAQAAIDRKLAARKLSLFPMRIIERPAELKEVKPR